MADKTEKKAQHSQEKRVLTDKKANERNQAKKSRIKTAIKAFKAAVEEKNKEVALEKLNVCISLINKAKSDGIYKKNTAARKVSTLTKLYNTL